MTAVIYPGSARYLGNGHLCILDGRARRDRVRASDGTPRCDDDSMRLSASGSGIYA
jgi:hypothetical protein